ncbi:hypothetical protein SERP1723 [Staphylococcus epidermidis RP62A]|uniref:Uncharacterized protein n=1 Tax=Staphylococcus epidermidis (strain ATCC 35984 / DSM 28319 / BCRC 17069 / CCUG 31568 / BM 3577 / RP62A) TaxID=176279 RepID=Q5HMA6_STAEQ|nr:hypothetical protein [Staphylococcus epidermidis]AAW55029.1 hypothetical protein SERP1723 [Staphylococcus epidermidis RP62A]EHQ76786.1 hypothetical protein SEVCU041_0505 [Staphylococcus epidermidis VCU041]MBC3089258.1 hypothetical protein [Staphylococcus epidermidis]
MYKKNVTFDQQHSTGGILIQLFENELNSALISLQHIITEEVKTCTHKYGI